jgi:polysaccharide lyase-like protein
MRVVFLAAVAALILAPAALAGRAITFRGDFETGDISQWTWGGQCANTGVPSSGPTVRGTVVVQSRTVAQGRYAARFQLPAATTYTACETLQKRWIRLGRDDYYGLMVRFPRRWREPSAAGWGLALAQLNYEGIWGAPVGIYAHAKRVRLILNSGLCRPVGTPYPPGPGCANNSGPGGNVRRMIAIPAPLVRRKWHQLIVHVRWTTRRNGIIEVWHRLKGHRAWNKTVSRRGYPTVQWTAEGGPGALAGARTVDKIGAYRGHSAFPLAVWHDGFVRTASFASAARALRFRLR